jgi:diguanylate cyclase (GGDEF)-like protein
MINSAKVRDALYRFHKELNRPFAGPDEMLERAIELMSEQLDVERISIFEFDARRQELMLTFARHRDLWLEVDEEIHLTEFSPLWRLAQGGKKYLSYTKPYALLYVPLRWPLGREGEPLGVLRLENSQSSKAFSATQREFAYLLAAEMSQNLLSIRVSTKRERQLRRLQTLTDLTAVFASSLRVEDGLKLILQGIAQHFQLDRVRLYLVDRSKKILRGELSVDVRGRVMSLKSDEVSLESSEHRFAKVLKGGGLDSHMKRYEERVVYLPLTVQGQKIGLLIVDNLVSQQSIEEEDIGLLKSFAGQIALAVDNARLFEEVQALSLYDSLTGLPVRRFFQQRFQEEMYRVERSGEPLSLAMIDIDYFKGVNDTYGHQIGDQVLQAVGKTITSRLRKIDFPCRYGGDEILILLPQTDEVGAAGIMKRLLQEIRDIRIAVPFSRAQELAITASIGIASYPTDARTEDELVQRADEALYWVKSKGRDGVASYQEAVKKKAPTA